MTQAPVTLGLDVYGTLLDPLHVSDELKILAGSVEPGRLVRLWRQKQLEYSFRRALMGRYEPFSVCTQQALGYACAALNLHLDPAIAKRLMESYRMLPAHPGVPEGLAKLKTAGAVLTAFSNGEADAVKLLVNAGLRDMFSAVISVEHVRTFKPAPAVYEYLRSQTQTYGGELWLVSSNPFDVIGAAACAIKSAWLRRPAQPVFDPWGIEPDLVVGSLSELAEHFARA